MARLDGCHRRTPAACAGGVALIAFRNVEVDPSRPLDEWPAEAIETLIDRGMRSDWARLMSAIEVNPWGPPSRVAENVASWGEHDSIDVLVLDAVAQARRTCDTEARRRYASLIRGLRKKAELTLRELAQLAGTSASRLSDYENAEVAPTTEVLGRIEHVIAAHVARPVEPGI